MASPTIIFAQETIARHEVGLILEWLEQLQGSVTTAELTSPNALRPSSRRPNPKGQA